MKTEVKMGLGLFAALVVVVAAAYFYPHKDGSTTADNAELAPNTGGSLTPARPSVTTPGKGGMETPSITGITPSTRATALPVDIFPPTQPTSAPAPTTEPTPPVKADWDSLVGSKSGSGTSGGGFRPNGPTLDFGGGNGMSSGPISGGGKSTAGLAGNTYTVKKGDTFSVISTAVYGSPNYWSKIAAANPGVSSNRLKVGQQIKIPPVSDVKPSETDAPKHTPVGGSSLVKDASSEYAVQAGDTLTKISQKLYGNGNRADAIYKLNKEKIGSSPNRLKVGMVLKLPAAPKTPATLPSR